MLSPALPSYAPDPGVLAFLSASIEALNSPRYDAAEPEPGLALTDTLSIAPSASESVLPYVHAVASYAPSSEGRESNLLALEKHFTPTELSEKWNLAPAVIRDLFKDEAGVIVIGKPSRREGKSLKRSYFSLRIPESVAARVHSRLSTKRRRPTVN